MIEIILGEKYDRTRLGNARGVRYGAICLGSNNSIESINLGLKLITILISPYLHVPLDFAVISTQYELFINAIDGFVNIFDGATGVNKLPPLTSITRCLNNLK